MKPNDIYVKAHRNGDIELKNGSGRYADVLGRGRVSAGSFGWTWCLDAPFEIPFRTGYSGTKTRNEALVAMVDAFIARQS